MARRARKSNTISLAEALALLAEYYPRNLAEEKTLLAMATAASKRRLEYEFDGPRVEGEPTPADVLKRLTGQGGPQLWPTVNWAASSIEYHFNGRRCTLYRFRLVRADVEELLPEPSKPKRKAGPGREQVYPRDVIVAAARRVLARGVPDQKQVYFDQVRNEVPRGTKMPPDDYPTLNRICGHLYDAAKAAKKRKKRVSRV